MHARITLAVISMATLLALPARAQKFQEPTQEELRMTADPMAPGAPAVFLERADETDFGAYYVSHYARIKVLTEEGKAWARVEIKYDAAILEPPIIEGRTINPDGTVRPLPKLPPTPKVDDAAAVKLQATIFTLPDVTVGSILEYKWSLPIGTRAYPHVKSGNNFLPPHYWTPFQLLTPRWQVQDRLYTHAARFRFNTVGLYENVDVATHFRPTWRMVYIDGERAQNLVHSDRLPPGMGVTQSVNGQYTLEVHDIPALPYEPDAPPPTSRELTVQFCYAPYATPDQYWDHEIKRWSRDLKSDTEVTRRVQEISDTITTGATSPDDKARRLYQAVQGLKNEAFIPGASSPERRTWFQDPPQKPERVWEQKGGTPLEIARLYLALCKAAGLDARGVVVVDRSRHIFDRNFMSLEQFDSLLVVINFSGKEIYTDPGEKLIPFGELYWGHTISTALDQLSDEPKVTPPNPSKDAITAHTADLIVSLSGNVTGSMQLVMNGPSALHWRQLNLTAGSDEMKNQLTESLHKLLPTGMSAEIAAMRGVETSEGYFANNRQSVGPSRHGNGQAHAPAGFLILLRAAAGLCKRGQARVAD